LVFPKNQVCCLIPFVGLCSCVSLRMWRRKGWWVFLFGTVVDEFVSSFGAYASCEVWMSPHQRWFSGFLWELYLQLGHQRSCLSHLWCTACFVQIRGNIKKVKDATRSCLGSRPISVALA
jgi:hypothetical protein